MAKKKETSKTVKKTAVTKTHYIVVWDNEDGDPVRVFNNLGEAEKFCMGLVLHDDDMVNGVGDQWVDVDEVVRESVKLYKGTLLGKAEVSVTFK